METEREIIWNVARILRDRAWEAQHDGPGGLFEDDEHPVTDGERHWYEQGKAEAFAAIMTECERLSGQTI